MKKPLLMFFCIAIPAYLLSSFLGLDDYLNLLGPTKDIIKFTLLAGFVFIMVEFWRSDTTTDDKLFWTIGTLLFVPIALPLMYFNKLQDKKQSTKGCYTSGTAITAQEDTSDLNQGNIEMQKALTLPQKAAYFSLSAPLIADFIISLTKDAIKVSKISYVVVNVTLVSVLAAGFGYGIYSLIYSKRQKKIIIPAMIGISCHLIIAYIAYAGLG
ncbi:hypothetical protein [Geomonas ferrireducens]|uniref:hypothetical protein n=1 Tax=Geomonas ferrireducens TaxID=2570227 RepID=UPI0010A87E63|nr:hypothetical protein [Geomonas ferrireducens]